jgi:hypothetical protein
MSGVILSVGSKPKREAGMVVNITHGRRTCFAGLAGAFLVVT